MAVLERDEDWERVDTAPDMAMDLESDMELIPTVVMDMEDTRSVHTEATIRMEDMVAILIQRTDTRDTVITADSVHVINSNIK